MRHTTVTISITRLKAKLSEHLRRVKAGETVIVTERDRPIAMMKPLPPEMLADDVEGLAEAGLLRPASASLPPGYWDRDRPADPDGSVRQAILEEREEGR